MFLQTKRYETSLHTYFIIVVPQMVYLFYQMRLPRLLQKSPRSPVAAPLVMSAVNTPVTEPPTLVPGAEPTEPNSNSCEDETTYTFSRHAIRSNYMDKSIEAKKKVCASI